MFAVSHLQLIIPRKKDLSTCPMSCEYARNQSQTARGHVPRALALCETFFRKRGISVGSHLPHRLPNHPTAHLQNKRSSQSSEDKAAGFDSKEQARNQASLVAISESFTFRSPYTA